MTFRDADTGMPNRIRPFRDEERALTAEGGAMVCDVRLRARLVEAAPSVILTSPLRRAVETAELAAEILGSKPEIPRTNALLPDGRAEEDVKKDAMARLDLDAAGPQPQGLFKWLLTPALARAWRPILRIGLTRLEPCPTRPLTSSANRRR